MNALQRSIETEWLDWLPCNDPRAIGSRRDLRRLNMLMGHAGIFTQRLLKFSPDKTPPSILELGAGDGTLMLAVARRLAPCPCNIALTLLDRHQLLSEQSRNQFAALGWKAETVTADVFDFLDDPRSRRFDVIVANLFLHHFAEPGLARLFDRIASLAPLFIACEPRRDRRALTASRGLWVIGCNHVTRHDAQVSVRAGFTGSELSKLWPKQIGWALREQPAGWFSHCFVARYDAAVEKYHEI
jgi:SAM-dependent methyltransferase